MAPPDPGRRTRGRVRTRTIEDVAAGCWARDDAAPPYSEVDLDPAEAAYTYACGQPPADDFGLCPHHRRRLTHSTG